MKAHKMVLAGFGGQGVLTVGQLLANVAMHEDMEVSWMPSYGAEMRGGTANCTVIIDHKEIASPLINNDITVLLAMNTPSLEKFLPAVVSGGYVLVNDSLVAKDIGREDVIIHRVDFASLASEVGNMRTQNMIAYGRLGREVGFTPEVMFDVVMKKLGHKDPALLELNKVAIELGYEL